MILRDDRTVASTKKKLRLLEESYHRSQTNETIDAHIRELELESLRRLINQLKEEIARHEAHRSGRS